MTNAMRYMAHGLAWLCLALVASMGCLALPEDHGLPERSDDLAVLGLVDGRDDMSAFEKTETIAVWLVRERRKPSRTRIGFQSPITSGYIQSQLITLLFLRGDSSMMKEIAEDPGTDSALADAMRIALGLQGDPHQIPSLVRILQQSKEGYYRARAAEALGRLGASEAMPALRAALEDDFAFEGGGCFSSGALEYPVRRNASEALRMLEDPSWLSDSKMMIKRFTERANSQTGQYLVGVSTYFRSIGWSVTWDSISRRAVAKDKAGRAHVLIGERSVSVNGRDIHLPTAAVLKDGHFMLPISFGVKLACAASPLSSLSRLPSPGQP